MYTWMLTTKGWETVEDHNRVILRVNYPNQHGWFQSQAILKTFGIGFTEFGCEDVIESKLGIIKQYDQYTKYEPNRLKNLIGSIISQSVCITHLTPCNGEGKYCVVKYQPYKRINL